MEEVLLFFMSYHGVDDLGQNLKVFRMIRFLKLFRVMRVLRIVRFVQQLNNLVYLIQGSLVPFMWTFTLMMLLVYTMGLFCTQLVSAYAREQEVQTADTLRMYYGTLGDSVLTMWQAVSGGLDWRELANPMMKVTPLLAPLFFGYTAFIMLVMMNLVTGIFVDNARSLRERETKRSLMKKLQRIFKSARRDARQSISATPGKGNAPQVITEESFKSQMAKPEMRQLFEKLNLEGADGASVFKLLDITGDGQLTFEEFVLAGLRLHGPAQAIDLAKFTIRQEREFKSLKEQLSSFTKNECKGPDRNSVKSNFGYYMSSNANLNLH